MKYNLAEIPRGKVTPVQTTFSTTHKSRMVQIISKVVETLPDPRVVNVLMPSLFRSMPLPREEREKVVAELEKVVNDRASELGLPPEAAAQGQGEAPAIPAPSQIEAVQG